MHQLERAPVVREVERAASAHLGRRWTVTGFTDLDDRASHPAGILHGDGFSVFAKLGTGPAPLTAELRGLDLIRRLAPVATPGTCRRNWPGSLRRTVR